MAVRFFRLRQSGKISVVGSDEGKNGLAERGIVTAKAVTLFKSSLRCGGLRRVAPPCPFQGIKNRLLTLPPQ